MATEPSGLAGVKNETQDFLHLGESVCASLMSWRRWMGASERDIVLRVLFARALSVCRRQEASQMDTPWADPCLCLARAQLAAGAEHAGPHWPSGTAKRRDLRTRWSYCFCYLAVTLSSFFTSCFWASYFHLSKYTVPHDTVNETRSDCISSLLE